jgi:orotate phosphoribosyltransferase
MSSLDDLIGRAKLLLAEGHSPGQIADELSLSMETVTWLLTQGKGTAAPKDVHIDWTAVSSQAPLLEETALMLLQRYYGNQSDESVSSPAAEVIVGIALSGMQLLLLSRRQQNLQSITRQNRTRASDRWDQSAGILPQSVGSVVSSLTIQ